MTMLGYINIYIIPDFRAFLCGSPPGFSTIRFGLLSFFDGWMERDIKAN